MAAPKGNCNASKNQALCQAKAGTKNRGGYNASKAKTYQKGWYRSSGSRKQLGKAMGAYKRKQRDWWVSSQPFADRKRFVSPHNF